MSVGKWRQTTIRQTTDWLAGRSLEETLMMHIDSGRYMSLNETATLLWEMLEQPRQLEDLVTKLTETFDVTPDQALQDSVNMLDELEKEGAIVAVPCQAE